MIEILNSNPPYSLADEIRNKFQSLNSNFLKSLKFEYCLEFGSWNLEFNFYVGRFE